MDELTQGSRCVVDLSWMS